MLTADIERYVSVARQVGCPASDTRGGRSRWIVRMPVWAVSDKPVVAGASFRWPSRLSRGQGRLGW